MAKKKADSVAAVTASSGNVFEDIGFAPGEAAVLAMRADLMGRLRLVIEEHLLRLRDDGLTMLMVEHELATVDRCCNSVVVMARGKVLASGTMSALRQNREVIDAYLVG